MSKTTVPTRRRHAAGRPLEPQQRALLAGADVLLMPPDPVAARDGIVAAVQSGRIPRERLDDAVLRILQTKERLGLLRAGMHGPMADWRQRVDTKAARTIAEEIARRGITLVRDPQGLVPLPPGEPWTLVTLSDQAAAASSVDATSQALAEELQARGVPLAERVLAHLNAAELAKASAATTSAKLLLVALHVKIGRAHV